MRVYAGARGPGGGGGASAGSKLVRRGETDVLMEEQLVEKRGRPDEKNNRQKTMRISTDGENKRLGDLTNDRVTTATGIRSCGTTAARLI